MRKKTNKIIAFALSVLMLLSSSPAMASSIGSVSGDKTIGEDTAQGASTAYSNVGVGSSKTNVYLTIDDSNVLVGVPTEIIISGTPTDTGEYIGEYSVSAFGDISGDEFVNIVPEENATLKQPGKKDVEASVSQQKTSFSYNDIITNNNSSIGQVTAEGLTAGSWNGEFLFKISIEGAYAHSISEIAESVMGYNGTYMNSATYSYYDGDGEAKAIDNSISYNTYVLPVEELGLNVGDILYYKNVDTDGFQLSLGAINSSWGKVQEYTMIASMKSKSITITDNIYALYFRVVKSTSLTDTGSGARTTFNKTDIPFQNFKLYKNSISDFNEIDYLRVLDDYITYDENFNYNKLCIHNVDADYRDDVAVSLDKYGFWDVDLRKTSDGVYVNTHNASLGNYSIANTTYEELKAAYPDTLFTVDEILQKLSQNTEKYAHFQFKNGDGYWPGSVTNLYNKMVSYGVEDRCFFTDATPMSQLMTNVNNIGANALIFGQVETDFDISSYTALDNCSRVAIGTSNSDTISQEHIQELLDNGVEVWCEATSTNFYTHISIMRKVQPFYDNLLYIATEGGRYDEYVIAATRYVNGI